jgi:hypothetical protein
MQSGKVSKDGRRIPVARANKNHVIARRNDEAIANCTGYKSQAGCVRQQKNKNHVIARNEAISMLYRADECLLNHKWNACGSGRGAYGNKGSNRA